MASGSGKNQDDTETKEPVERLESNAAAGTEPTPLAPQSEIIDEEVHGPPEAGGRDPSAATAAAAERKGEETMSLFRRGSAGSKPRLPPRPPFVPRARGPSSAGGKPPRPPRPMSREEVLASGMAMGAKWKSDRENHIDRMDLFNELMLECQRSGEVKQKAEAEGRPMQVTSPVPRPKQDKKPLWRKCHCPQRNVMIAALLILAILLRPAQTEAFQHFGNLEDAAQRLAALHNLGDLRLQLEEETPGAGCNFCLSPIMVAICTFLVLGLFSWFIDPKEEH